MSSVEAPPLQASRPSAADIVAFLGGFVGFLAAVALPFLTLRPNRIVSGQGIHLWEIAEGTIGPIGVAVFFVIAVALVLAGRHDLRAGIAASACLILIALAGIGATVLLPDIGFARVSFASGFWIALGAFALVAVDALVRLRLPPLARLAVLVAVVGSVVALVASGIIGGLSILREYAAYRDVFSAAAGEHLLLIGGSLLPALLIGLPLGRWCYRSERVRGIALPVLNIFQTIPSVALFGLLMIPLAMLAARFPILAEFGVHGIGRAPALIALFLYALLPVVANTMAGFRSVDPSVLEVGAGMGMTRAQRMTDVEVPLALPVILGGIRIALVQNTGLAAIAALIGGGGFGTLIFRGMGQAAIDLVLLGAIPIVVLSILATVAFDAAIEAAGGKTR